MDVNREINYSNFRSQFTHEFGSNIKRILYKNSFLAGNITNFSKTKEHKGTSNFHKRVFIPRRIRDGVLQK